MRILGIETSSRRGSVALMENARLVARAEHEQASAHAERILPLIAELLAKTGWTRTSLDRIGVGVGPGSFVGLRVGLALADGLALGLGRPVVGVCSLQAMMWGAHRDANVACAALLDARRDEIFCAANDANGKEVIAPSAILRAELAHVVASLGANALLVGEVARELGLPNRVLSGALHDLPDAEAVAAIAATLDPASAVAKPLYVRGPGATRPSLPPSPLGTPSSNERP